MNKYIFIELKKLNFSCRRMKNLFHFKKNKILKIILNILF